MSVPLAANHPLLVSSRIDHDFHIGRGHVILWTGFMGLIYAPFGRCDVRFFCVFVDYALSLNGGEIAVLGLKLDSRYTGN